MNNQHNTTWKQNKRAWFITYRAPGATAMIKEQKADIEGNKAILIADSFLGEASLKFQTMSHAINFCNKNTITANIKEIKNVNKRNSNSTNPPKHNGPTIIIRRSKPRNSEIKLDQKQKRARED